MLRRDDGVSMYVSYATAMDLASGSIDLAAEVVRAWLEDAGFGRLDLSRDDRTKLRNVEARWRVDPRHALELELVERAPSGSASTTAVHLAGEQRKDRAVIVRTQSMPSGSPDLLGLADAPAVVPSLLRALDAMDGDLVVLPDPVVFSAADIDALVDELTDTTRRLPVLVVSADATGTLDPEAALRVVVGQVHVRVLRDDAARWALSRQVGGARSCFGGAARVYWPGFDLACDPTGHRHWSRDVLATDRRRVLEWLRYTLTAAAAARLPRTGPVARRRGGVQDVAIAAGLAAEVEELRETTEHLHSELARAQRRVAELERAGDEYATVEQAVRAVAAAHPHLQWCDEAFESAAASTYRRPERAHSALEALAEAAARYAADDLPGGWAGFFREAGVRYSSGVSDLAKGRWPHEYRRRWNGREVWLGPHLQMGSGPPHSCLRIYWWVDEDNREVVIGHVGRHLTDSMTGG